MNDDPSPPAESSHPEKTLKEIIAEKSGVLSPDDTMEEAGEKMRSMDTDSMPVTEGSKLVGVVNQRDSDRKAAGRGHDPKQILVSESMSREVAFCYEDQDRSEAQRMMIEKQLRYLPVVDHDLRIVGMITLDDLGSDSSAGPAKTSEVSIPNHIQEL